MNKALEDLEFMYSKLDGIIYCEYKNNIIKKSEYDLAHSEITNGRDNIKQALLKEESLKEERDYYKNATKIIAEKVVDVNYLLATSSGDVEDYNRHVEEISKVAPISYCKLTEKEFNLVYNSLKGWLKDE